MSNVDSLMFVNLFLDIDIWIADLLFEKTIMVFKEFMMMTEIYSFNQQMDDTYDISHGDWVSACCSLW